MCLLPWQSKINQTYNDQGSNVKLNHAMPYQTRPNKTKLCNAYSYSVLALNLSIMIKKVIQRVVGCGGGVVYLSNYRTTPVNIVQLCTGLGCGNM